ncbi:MAG TPA: hypothetical protein VFT19_08995 [Solirubrobacterales bacterium]|nr:hypothetical protein [Solirubrobacterales bacterium]
MAPWKLPLIVAGIAVPVAAAFALGGAAAGVAAGALVAAAIVVVAARQRPLGPIGATPAEDEARHVLLVLTCTVEEPADVRRLLAAAGLDGGRAKADVLVLSPAEIGFLDRWASDVEGAREAAQQNLVATVAALAKAGIVAEARVGDEDVVQAVEDQLQSFAASEVVLVSEAGADHSDAAAELRSRLRAEFRQVELGG